MMEMHEIYQSERSPGKWLVSTGRGGFGDTIHDSEQDARKYVDNVRALAESWNARINEKELKEKERREQEEKRLQLVNAYCDDMKYSPMKRGKVIKTLCVKLRYCIQNEHMEVMERHQAIARRVDLGWRFKQYSFGVKFASIDDHFSELTQTEINFANWLIERKEKECNLQLTEAT